MEKIWEKFYVEGVPSSFQPEQITLDQGFKRSVTRFPDHPALIFRGTTVSFRELDEMVSTFVSALRSLGVVPGTRVSIVLPNLIQTVVSIYGALRAGAVVVMHNPRSHTRSLENQFNDAQTEYVISLDLLVPRLLNLLNSTKVRKIISCHIRDYLPFLAQKLFPFVKSELHGKTPDDPNVHEFTDLMNQGGPALSHGAPDMHDTAFILYTSATTGDSKGVELSHGNMSANVQQLKSWFPNFVDGKEILVGCLPFFHVFGLTCALNAGLYNGYADVLVPVPEPKDIIKAIDSSKATFIPALPGLYNAVANDRSLRKYSLKSLTGCFSGASPLPRETIREFEYLTGAQICEGYGLTESSPVTHINPFGGIRKAGTIGLPVPGTEAKIVDPLDHTREMTRPGEMGELCIKGPQVMKGYVNLTDDTNAAIKDDWLLTGDIVSMDSHGFFSVFDRKKDIIHSPLEMIYPRDVEEVIFTHPKVRDAGVVGVKETNGNEIVTAFIVLKKGEQASVKEMIDHCKAHLQAHQVPSRVEFIDEMPRSVVGKTLRKELRRLYLIKTFEKRKK